MMRPFIFSLTILLLNGCGPSAVQTNNPRDDTLANDNIPESTNRRYLQPDSLISTAGDFNGDSHQDLATVVPPSMDNLGHCEKCITKIAFSDSIDTLTIPYEANGAIIFNAGDLDGNKTDELLVIPGWFNSCLGTQWVYTYRINKWDTVASGQINRCIPQNTIKKIKNGLFQMTQYMDGQDSITTMKIK
ncbi:MAG: hypothetical protein H6585_00370 [Flavobacteriales bacterium]|nr:hypothetical protein [Flavobacteriales bacterium]MCB9446779.1 hypothetical protein [Flavobacteriales bacterium]